MSMSMSMSMSMMTRQAVLLRLKREMASYEQASRVWEVCWAAGGDFHLKVLAGLVLSQQASEYPSSSTSRS
jgi:hypothetical protein